MKKQLILTALVAALAMPAAANAAPDNHRRDRQEQTNQRDMQQRQRAEVRQTVRAPAREAWQDYRQTHREAFRAPKFKSRNTYRTFAIGTRLNTSYYGSAYRVNDYARYRLPRPGRAQAYVRNYNDLLLVNTRSGVVLKVLRNFYW